MVWPSFHSLGSARLLLHHLIGCHHHPAAALLRAHPQRLTARRRLYRCRILSTPQRTPNLHHLSSRHRISPISSATLLHSLRPVVRASAALAPLDSTRRTSAVCKWAICLTSVSTPRMVRRLCRQDHNPYLPSLFVVALSHRYPMFRYFVFVLIFVFILQLVFVLLLASLYCFTPLIVSFLPYIHIVYNTIPVCIYTYLSSLSLDYYANCTVYR